MNNPLSFSRLLIIIVFFLFASAVTEAATIVHYFGPDGTGSPQRIAPLDTIIGEKSGNGFNPEYHALTSSNTDFKFVRHIETEDICYYWFRADGNPYQYTNLEQWSDVYYYVGNVGDDQCTFVDGAEFGSNNYVLLHSASAGKVVGVLQYDLNDSNDINYPARLIAYAINLDGLTFAEGVAAIQAIPEPSTVALVSLALIGGLLKLRRRA